MFNAKNALINHPLIRKQTGATLAEFVVVAPVLFLVMLGIIQFCLMSHAKSQVYYATYEAARAASAYDPKKTSQSGAMMAAFERAIIGYYGGGATQGEIDAAKSRAQGDLSQALIISSKMIDDQYVTVTSTFGIPENKQVYFVGPIFVELLAEFGISGDARTMVNRGRIPVTVEVTMHLSPIAMKVPPWKKNLENP